MYGLVNENDAKQLGVVLNAYSKITYPIIKELLEQIMRYMVGIENMVMLNYGFLLSKSTSRNKHNTKSSTAVV